MTNKEFVVTRATIPKNDQLGVQRLDKADRLMWSTQVVVTDDDGGEVITITTTGEKPDVYKGDPVEVKNLVAIPWNTNGRNGIAYRADNIIALEEDLPPGTDQ